MQLYEMNPTTDAKSVWCGTRGEAHEAAKLAVNRPDVRIYLWEVDTSKASILQALNGGVPKDKTLVSAWGLTNRGGLLEVPHDVALREMEA